MEHAAKNQALGDPANAGAPPVGEGSDVEATAAEAAYDAAGVDRTLIRWMLGLTPTERLRHVQGTIDLVRQAKRVPNGDR